MNIGLRIKQIRLNTKMNLKAFSKEIGIDNSQYGKIEKGILDPTLDLIMEICSKYLISADWLLTGKGDMQKNKASSINQKVAGKYNKQFANSNHNISDINEMGYINENELAELKQENILIRKQLSEKDTLIKTLIEQQQTLINKLK